MSEENGNLEGLRGLRDSADCDAGQNDAETARSLVKRKLTRSERRLQEHLSKKVEKKVTVYEIQIRSSKDRSKS